MLEELSEELISYCREVLLICGGRQVNGDEWRDSMLREVVAKGRRYMGCVVKGVKPELEDASTDACIVYKQTTVRVANVSRVQVLEQDEEATIVKHGDYVYVYPTQLIKEIEEEYIKPIMRGDVPLNPGLLLIGPPGTGKTSMLKILADSVGFSRVEVTADQVLSKYVGESEQRLRKIIDDAFEREPSIIIVDDVEWLMVSREFAEGRELWRYSMFQVLADGIDRVRRERRAVLIAAATNVNTEVLDIALRRHGRFGEPKVIPPPTSTMLAKWITHAAQHVPWIRVLAGMVGLDKLREFVAQAAYGGNSMSEVETALRKWLLGPRIP
jgi:SpoVK/Ycf46/Vps4 family AAA+-type ATPase